MSAPSWGWVTPFLSSDSPLLPTAWVMQWALGLSWSVVLAWLGASVVGYWSQRKPLQWGVALGLAFWSWIPGPYAPMHWLGLAFQTPSLVTVLLCAVNLRAQLFSARTLKRSAAPTHRASLVLAALGVLAGWTLLLDTFAWLPVQLYQWGFSPAASALVLLVVLVPWVIGRAERNAGIMMWVAPLAILLFVVLRLPTGNLWDAVLDPWLWIALHVVAVRCYSVRGRNFAFGVP